VLPNGELPRNRDDILVDIQRCPHKMMLAHHHIKVYSSAGLPASTCLTEARVVISDWREDYNTRRPHSSLGMRAPAAFAAEWTADTAALAA
jgi:transposase InsO family protein